MRRIPDWLVYGLILLALWMAFGGPADDTDMELEPREDAAQEEPLLPDAGIPLDGPSLFDQTSIVEAEAVQPGTIGTAFAVADGVWLTARHVVRGCPAVWLTDARMTFKVRADLASISDRADVAVLRTEGGPPPLAMDLDEQDLTVGTAGFHVGYPGGQPGEVESRLIGRERMVTSGAWRGRENTLAWAEVRRSQGLTGSLGGLSGGPVFDASGNALGITIAESARRGRVITTAADSVVRDLDAAAVTPEGSPASGFAPDTNWSPAARAVRRDQQVLLVMCLEG